MATAAASRPYQVVVWGASGFTGRLVCEHLCRDYSGRVRWAMAGRDARRLEAVRDELSRINPDVKNVPILVADASDKAALSSVMKQTQVVLALVGPFAKYGDQVVAQAVEEGTHYCDITGETPWVKRNVSKYDSSAKSKGVKVVHCCGYDSIPSDLGALMMATYCQTVLKKKIAQIYHLVSCKGTLSGGTVASGINMVEGEPMKELMAMTTNAYYVTNGTGPDRPAPSIPTYIKEAGVWAGPFMMESCNARIVHYSNSIRPQGPYGPNFKFCEVSNCGTGWNGWLGAVGLSAVTAVAGMVFTLAPLRALAKRALPAPGQGPSLEARVNGWWKHTLIAVTDEPEGGKPLVVKGECGDKRDPGYWSTSRMILETGLALVLDEDAIAKSGTCLPGGVLTPATAAGMVLVDRLNKAGYTFKVDGVVGEDGKVVPESKVQAEALISSRKA